MIYPPYLSKYFSRVYFEMSKIGLVIITYIVRKTTMLNGFARWIIRAFIMSLAIIVIPISYFVNIRRNKKCPPPSNPLLFKTATSLAEMIRNKQITSEEVIKAYVERCREVNPYLNAVVEPRYEPALQEARNIDVMIASSGKSPDELALEYPLLGLPITVKESLAVEGMSNEAGTYKPDRTPATKDCTVVRLARSAGAIPICVTNTPQLCMNWETYNCVTGLTKNPYDQKRTVGGSSGGEAALLAAGASLIGLGSDIGGSLRLPPMFNGVYGHKPTPHVVSTEGHVPACLDPDWDEYFAVGPMTRYAEDLPLIMKVLSQPDGPPLNLHRKVDIRKLKFYYMEGDGSMVTNKIGQDVSQAMQRVRDYFGTTYKIEVQKIEIKDMHHMFEISARVLMNIDDVQTILTRKDDPKKSASVWPEIFKKMFFMSKESFTGIAYPILKKFFNCLPKRNYKQVTATLENIKSEFNNYLKDDAILFYPTYPTTAHIHYRIYYKFLNLSYLCVFNVLGLPVTNCPLGLTSKGLPVGLQVVANKGNDNLTMAVAKELENAFGGWVPPNETIGISV